MEGIKTFAINICVLDTKQDIVVLRYHRIVTIIFEKDFDEIQISH